mmetsp:Transcript_10380/g.13738  ORF Transcript_10380/g.13738 Transcript_10380/m.13738 type:complete len:91 (+) Transcript_10380:160-432(+)
MPFVIVPGPGLLHHFRQHHNRPAQLPMRNYQTDTDKLHIAHESNNILNTSLQTWKRHAPVDKNKSVPNSCALGTHCFGEDLLGSPAFCGV